MAAYRRVDDLRSPAGWLPVHRDQLRANARCRVWEAFTFYRGIVSPLRGNKPQMWPILNILGPFPLFSPIWGNLACYGEPEVCCSKFKLIDASRMARNKFDQVWIFGGSNTRFHSLVRRNLRCKSKPNATALLHQMLSWAVYRVTAAGRKHPKLTIFGNVGVPIPLLYWSGPNFGMGEWTMVCHIACRILPRQGWHDM